MSTIEKELKKEEVSSGCCGGNAKQSESASQNEAKTVESDKEKKSASGCCGG